MTNDSALTVALAAGKAATVGFGCVVGFDVAHGNVEVSLWRQNLTNNDRIEYPNWFDFLGATPYTPARTFGVDLSYDH